MAAVPNLLLASLPRRTYRDLVPDLVPATLAFGRVLYEPDARMEQVYFPASCLVSLLTVTDRHLALEVGMVGREGFVGASVALGVATSPVRALVQGAGAAMRMSAGRFSSALQRSPALRDGVQGYIHRLMNQISRTAACNRFHVVEKRLARWLLMTRDRLGSDDFRGVTEAAASLQQRKLIAYRRGSIRILDVAGLRAASCSCYVEI